MSDQKLFANATNDTDLVKDHFYLAAVELISIW